MIYIWTYDTPIYHCVTFIYFSETLKHLWRTEGLKIFSKGLTARMTSSIIYSIAIIFGYETVKKWSVHEEYKPMVKW